MCCLTSLLLKLLEENIEEIHSSEQIFFGYDPKKQDKKSKNWKTEHIKLKSFCKAKKTIITVKQEPIEWVKIFANYSSDEGLISRVSNELRTIAENPNNLIKNWANDLSRHILKEDM